MSYENLATLSDFDYRTKRTAPLHEDQHVFSCVGNFPPILKVKDQTLEMRQDCYTVRSFPNLLYYSLVDVSVS